MKKILFKGLFVFFFFSLLISIWCFLMPEKKTISAVSSNAAPADTECFKANILKEYDQTVTFKISSTLTNIYVSNQTSLMLIADAIKTHGANSEEVKKLLEMKDVQDKINLDKVKEIIDKYGWPGADKIGAQNNYTLFATLQNSDYETQEKYMPIMEKAVKSGTLSAEHYASFVDRKALVQHQKQIFGTQVRGDMLTGKYSFAPIIDEDLVNKRRSEIGLPPIEEAAKFWNIDYSPSQKNS